VSKILHLITITIHVQLITHSRYMYIEEHGNFWYNYFEDLAVIIF